MPSVRAARRGVPTLGPVSAGPSDPGPGGRPDGWGRWLLLVAMVVVAVGIAVLLLTERVASGAIPGA